MSLLSTPLRMVKRRYMREPIKRHRGEPNDICRQIIADCFDKKRGYFMVSRGHFQEFYMRDFGMCVEALLALGHADKVLLTLTYALSRFKKYNKVTTTINDDGHPVNFFAYPCDSLPFLIRTIRVIKQHTKSNNLRVLENIIFDYREFLERQVDIYVAELFDFQTGMVKERKNCSSIRDHTHLNSSTYANSMAGMLSIELDLLGWPNPLHDIPIGKKIYKHRWRNMYFRTDASNDITVTADANVFPFYCGVIKSNDMLRKAIETMQRAKLDHPFPLKYANKNSWRGKNLAALLAPNYEGTAIWAHLGLCYLYVLDGFDDALLKKHLRQYFLNIKQWGNFLEVYQPDGKRPYKSVLYFCDADMLWASMYLHLARKHDIK